MKKLLVLSLAVVAVICFCSIQNVSAEKVVKKTQTTHVKKNKIKTVTELYKVAEKMVGKVVACKGKVKHVCEHTGKRCFLIDKEGNTIKINAAGTIKVFDKKILGKNISVKGKLQMVKITEEQIKKMEEEEEHCDTESSNVKKMRAWMKKNKKNYFAFYYIDCTEYKTIK